MRIKRLSALLLSALLITSPIGYMTVNGDTIDAKIIRSRYSLWILRI